MRSNSSGSSFVLERGAGSARVPEVGRRAEARRERHRVARLVVDQVDLLPAEEVLDPARRDPEPWPQPLAVIVLPRPVTRARRREGARPEVARRLVQPRLLVPADGHVVVVGLVQRRHRRIPLDLLDRLLLVPRTDLQHIVVRRPPAEALAYRAGLTRAGEVGAVRVDHDHARRLRHLHEVRERRAPVAARTLGRVAIELDVVSLLCEVLLDRVDDLAVRLVETEQVVDRSIRGVRHHGRAHRRAPQPGRRRRAARRENERERHGERAIDTPERRHRASVSADSHAVVRVATQCVPAQRRSAPRAVSPHPGDAVGETQGKPPVYSVPQGEEIMNPRTRWIFQLAASAIAIFCLVQTGRRRGWL